MRFRSRPLAWYHFPRFVYVSIHRSFLSGSLDIQGEVGSLNRDCQLQILSVRDIQSVKQGKNSVCGIAYIINTVAGIEGGICSSGNFIDKWQKGEKQTHRLPFRTWSDCLLCVFTEDVCDGGGRRSLIGRHLRSSWVLPQTIAELRQKAKLCYHI